MTTHNELTPADVDAAELAEEAVALAARWLVAGRTTSTRQDRATVARLRGVVADPDGLAFAMRFVDRVIRPDDHAVAAQQLAQLVAGGRLPSFLSPHDRLLLRAGRRLAPKLPKVVMPLAVRRMRSLVGHLLVDAKADRLASHLARRRSQGFRTNVNLLGEAVLGQAEADRRRDEALELLAQPDVDYVSVKLSSMVAQLNPWDFEGSVERVIAQVRPLFERAAATTPPTFVNLDMEEYHDLELTMAVFMRILDEPAFRHLEAGIVLQAYLPDSFRALQRLVAWATDRATHDIDGRPGSSIKVRLVKGANLAMEHVEAELHGWEQAPYRTKAETDANYKRCLDWVLTPERTAAVRVGVASHNLFDVAWARLLSQTRGVADRVEFEMLEGMAPSQARLVRDEANSVLLYTPSVDPADFDVAISYLFRRLEENAADENFIRHLFDLEPGSSVFEHQATRFRTAVADRWTVSSTAQRTQDRSVPPPATPLPTVPSFRNEPDTDPALPANRAWAAEVVADVDVAPRLPVTQDTADIDRRLRAATQAQRTWAQLPTTLRRRVLHRIADELASRRGQLISAMVHEAHKTVGQADSEVSEAVDFARYYGDHALDLDRHPTARFEPFGVIGVIPPWNFPVAIPAGGVLASLAAGNGVVLKPAPETPRCAEVVAACVWDGLTSAGVSRDGLQVVRVGDGDLGRHLITHPEVGAIILTGSYETAALFRSWRPDLRLFAETSGKNAMVISPNADIDLAVRDLVYSAFGHSGQKCSAASLGVCIGDVYDSPRFRRQLTDAVRTLQTGPAHDLATAYGPTIKEPSGKLLRALTQLDPGEEWLVEPRRVTVEGTDLWTPGVRLHVRPRSWFHHTECFGPVLGLMHADNLDDAIRLQNATDYGLTGGIHSLAPEEIGHWLDHVQVGNAYVNRPITGAIVQRQPFGGWKRSSVGPGAKAGGPGYVAQLGTWTPTEDYDAPGWLARAVADDEKVWREHVSAEHDATGLTVEANILRYRPLDRIVIRRQVDGSLAATERARRAALFAARTTGRSVVLSDEANEPTAQFAARLPSFGVPRVRVIGTVDQPLQIAANMAAVHLADDPVTADAHLEFRHYLREQSVSQTLHRYGNMVGS